MKMIMGEKIVNGVDRGEFLSGLVRDTQANVKQWLDFSGLTEAAAKEIMSGEGKFSFLFSRDDMGASISIYNPAHEQIGESILYEFEDGFSLDEWATDVSLLLLYIAANFGGVGLAEALTNFLNKTKPERAYAVHTRRSIEICRRYLIYAVICGIMV